MKKWPTLDTQKILDAHVFRYLKVKRQSPTTKEVGEFDIVQCFNWVNVIAITPEKKVVLIKQYRHGIDAVTVEIPGGAVNYNEDKLLAAKRELQEETGHTSDNWKYLGSVDANPAFMTNHCDTYLAIDATKTHDQNLDPFEEIDVFLEAEDQIKILIKNKEITHSLIIAAWYLYQNS